MGKRSLELSHLLVVVFWLRLHCFRQEVLLKLLIARFGLNLGGGF
jgi:hypothetical protein